jgi:hypothetical protein
MVHATQMQGTACGSSLGVRQGGAVAYRRAVRQGGGGEKRVLRGWGMHPRYLKKSLRTSMYHAKLHLQGAAPL